MAVPVTFPVLPVCLLPHIFWNRGIVTLLDGGLGLVNGFILLTCLKEIMPYCPYVNQAKCPTTMAHPLCSQKVGLIQPSA